MILVSLIVPIFKVENYLERCVTSLREQTYKNLEIILVDDGSPDECPEMCDEYAKLDQRIKVIHKPNGGLSDARNAGLALAKGEYIGFIDSDDWVVPEFVQILLENMISNDCDLIECEIHKTDSKMDRLHVPKDYSIDIYNNEDAMRGLILDCQFHQTVWNKLYKKRLLQDVLFQTGKCNEDEFWTYQIFGNAEKVAKLSIPLYYYYQRPGSIMAESYSIRRLDGIEAKVERLLYVKHNYPSLDNLAGTNLAASILYATQMVELYLDGDDKNKAIELLQEFNQKYIVNRWFSFEGDQKHIVWYKLQCISLRATARLRNLLRMNI